MCAIKPFSGRDDFHTLDTENVILLRTSVFKYLPSFLKFRVVLHVIFWVLFYPVCVLYVYFSAFQARNAEGDEYFFI